MSGGYPGYGYYATSSNVVSESSTPTSSVFGEHRPTFSDDGKGQPYTSMINVVANPALNQDISYDTSSRDPLMIRCRVFIGNIARAIITRDDIIDLFRPYGKLLGVNYFGQQGFGFVQFSEAKSADEACFSLNGKQWKACVLDVHLAMLGVTKKAVEKPTLVPPVPDPAEQSNKRAAEYDEEYEVYKQNKKNKKFALSDKTVSDDLAANGICDTLVCGSCRFITSDYEEFKDHRIAGCQRIKEAEPKHRLKCATCNQRFMGGWALLEHLTEFHRMLLYTEEPITDESDGSENSKPQSNEIAEKPVVYDQTK